MRNRHNRGTISVAKRTAPSIKKNGPDDKKNCMRNVGAERADEEILGE